MKPEVGHAARHVHARVQARGVKLIQERGVTVAQAARDLGVGDDGTHKHSRVKLWLKRHQRVHLRCIPTTSSWLHWVERWFREFSDKRIRRGSFKSLPELIAAFRDYLDHHNQSPRLFVWHLWSASGPKFPHVQKRWTLYT
jgi:hypothetical protein